MKNAKRILAFILSVLMVVTCVPGTVFAATEDEVSAVADTQYPGEATYSTYQGGTTGHCGPVRAGTGEALWGKIHIPAEKRLVRLVVPSMANYGATTPPKIRVSIFAATNSNGNTDDLNASVEGKTPLWEGVFTGPADNTDFVCEIPASVSLEGSLYFRLTCEQLGAGGAYQNGFTVLMGSSAANNAAFWFRTASINGSNNVLAFNYTVADVVKASASADLTQHTDDPIVTHEIQNYTVPGDATKSKIDFKRPTDRGFLTVEGVESDPFFEIGTLDSQISQIPGSKMDYIVIKYRTSNITTGRFFYDFDGRGHYSGAMSTEITFDDSGEWETVIVHADVLSGESRPVKNLRFDFYDGDSTTDGENPVMDIAYIRTFSTLSGAEACVEAEKHSLVALPITIRDYRADGMLFEYSALDPDLNGYPNHNLGNNGGFALTALIGSRNADLILGKYDPEVREKFEELIVLRDENGNDYTYVANGSSINTYQPEPDPIEVILNSGAKQDVYGAEIRYDLVEAELGENGKPVYRQGVVEFIAWYLEKLLPLPETTNGKTNMNFIKGEADEAYGGKDLASYLREKLANAQSGTYEATQAKVKDLVGGNGLNHIETYMDAAYFLLHNTFVDNPGYGMTANEYNTLNLVAKTDENGNVRYVFSTAFDNVTYDRVDGIIQNSQFELATQRRLNGNTGDWYYHRGNKQPVGCFDPLFGLGYDVNGASREQDTYRKMLGNYNTYSENIYYKTTNFHYTMEGHAHFVYHYSEDLYFTFIGDDDVYLYVNGKRIVDVGGTHPISKVKVSLNDVAEVCGLEEGGIYSFDFFYMERHGTAANLSIETNIRVADTSMITEKKAYQNGHEIGYDGVVDYNSPVEYTFSIFNNSQIAFKNLTFTDSDIGANLTYKEGESFALPEGVTVDKLVLTKYNPDGTVAESVTGLDEAAIREYLVDGLNAGERLTIGGFSYKIPEDKWVEQDGKTYYINHLYTTATTDIDNVTDKVLNGNDYHRVNKANIKFNNLHVYDWGRLNNKLADGSFVDVSKGVLITAEDIREIMEQTLGEGALSGRNLTFALSSPAGNLEGGDINKYVTALENGDFLYQAPKCGVDAFYVTCTADGNTYPPVRVDVYVYGVGDNVFVLDYNLPVTVLTQDHGLVANDILGLIDNPNGMDLQIEFLDFTDHFGTFSTKDEGLNTAVTYVMNKIMNGVDTFNIKITLMETDADGLSKWTGVEMLQTVTFAPANVMYYEDNFTGEGAITYVNTGKDATGNIWAVFEGDAVKDYQAPDQNLNYGSDPGYTAGGTNNRGQLDLSYVEGDDQSILGGVGDEIFQTIHGTMDGVSHAILGDASNDTIHAMAVNGTERAEIMSFTFTGTGFEIVGRTTAKAYALLTVKIENLKNGEVKAIPVITECVSGELTQVPYVVRKDMAHSTYRVTVYTSNYNQIARMVYVDGVRVYQPLTAEQSSGLYKADESNVTFHEIKTSIKNGTIVYGQVVSGSDVAAGAAKWQFGNTMIENFRPADDRISADLIMTQTDSVADYMTYGPNNEIYLSNPADADGNPREAFTYIAFYVELVEDFEGERSIQIGAHIKATGNDSPVEMFFGNSAEDFEANENVHSVCSGTEQYFTVEDDLVFSNPNGTNRALVIIGTSDLNLNVLALTNIKLNGYKLSQGTAAAEVSATQDMYDVFASDLMAETAAIYASVVKGSNN